MKTIQLCISWLLVTAATSAALAQHNDVLLSIDPEANLVAGLYDFDGGTVQSLGDRVFEGEFEGPFSNVWTIDEPGFNALSSNVSGLPAGYTTLPGSTPVSFDAKAFTIGSSTANLWHWDGSGAVDFTPVTSPTVLQISKSPTAVFSAILDGTASDVTGFVIDTTSTLGFLHKHIDFSVYNSDLTAPDTGFYLWSLVLEVSELQSQPLFFVHGLGIEDEEAHEAAIEFVRNTFIPEPNSFVAMAGLCLAVLLRRRRGR